jgi:hypothetical protein
MGVAGHPHFGQGGGSATPLASLGPAHGREKKKMMGFGP